MHISKLLVDGKLHESLTEKFREDTKTNCKEKNIPLPALRILDACSGTGCISLLLHHQLSRHFRNLRIIGLDISPTAVALSNENLKRNFRDWKCCSQNGRWTIKVRDLGPSSTIHDAQYL
jgi:methylase of polypeptide subunit release factors